MEAVMPDRDQTSNMALFCDFENIALGGARREVRRSGHHPGARTPAAQGQHRGQEGLRRLGALPDLQARHARGRVRAHRHPPRAPVGQELRRHPAGRGRARPVLHQVARRHLRDHQRGLGLLAAREQAPGERQDGRRARGPGFDLGSAAGELRRIHLLRRSGARARGAQEETPPGAREEGDERERKGRRQGRGGGPHPGRRSSWCWRPWRR